MAKLASHRASDPEVKQLAARIEKEQEQQSQTMKDLLSSWGQPTPTPGMAPDMPGSMSEEDMRKLAAAQGKDFDKLFVQQMIAHHRGAIEMARTEEADGANPQAKDLAKQIITTQEGS
ncbi:DUF305 domain-containing protein [Nonomuraea antimicrobica]